jgi:hypothetical protein
VCIADVAAEDCVAKYGPDDDCPIKIGAAKAGELFVAIGSLDKRGLFCAAREPNELALAFPASSFKKLCRSK